MRGRVLVVGIAAIAFAKRCTSFESSTAPVDASADAGAAVYDIACTGRLRCADLAVCCTPRLDATTGTTNPSCVPVTSCSGSSQYFYTCDDAEDCRAASTGGSCCGVLEGANMIRTTCRPTCLGNELELCPLLSLVDECRPSRTCTDLRTNSGPFAACK